MTIQHCTMRKRQTKRHAMMMMMMMRRRRRRRRRKGNWKTKTTRFELIDTQETEGACAGQETDKSDKRTEKLEGEKEQVEEERLMKLAGAKRQQKQDEFPLDAESASSTESEAQLRPAWLAPSPSLYSNQQNCHHHHDSQLSVPASGLAEIVISTSCSPASRCDSPSCH